MAFRTHFRDKKEWLDSTNGGMDLNTSSDEAAKYYDMLVTQYCGWYHDETIGGMDMALTRMLESDCEFILGMTLEVQLRHAGAMSSTRLEPSLHSLYEYFEKVVKSRADEINEHEKLHVEVVRLWSRNKMHEATKVLEQIITLYPDDVAALKMCQDLYFSLGPAPRMRNSCAYSLRAMSDKNPLKGYAHGIFSFALEESHMYQKSQEEALKALELIPVDTWAIHNYAHCLEMQAKVEEGLKWMKDKKSDWEKCELLACHQYWHTALFNINNNNFDEAIDSLDNDILPRVGPSSTSLDFHDAASMVYRMELVDLFEKQGKTKPEGARWKVLSEFSRPHRHDHLLGFNDAHYMMCFLGANELELAKDLMSSIDDEPELVESKTVVEPLLEAMYHFKLEDYAKTVDLLAPIRFEVLNIGGSHAQRDLFEQLLLVAALKSEKAVHNKLGQRMLLERESLHGRQVPQTQLLADQKRTS